MDDNPKLRGKQHLKNKSKYKNKSKSVSHPTVKFKTSPLQSNHDRYEEFIIEQFPSSQIVQHCGSDFSVLASAPISKGNHFQFKNDIKNSSDIEIEHFSEDKSGLFNLDLNLLGQSMASIPFNKRCSIPEKDFTVNQLGIIRRTAENNFKLYEESLLNLKGGTDQGIYKSRINKHNNAAVPNSIEDKSLSDRLSSMKGLGDGLKYQMHSVKQTSPTFFEKNLNNIEGDKASVSKPFSKEVCQRAEPESFSGISNSECSTSSSIHEVNYCDIKGHLNGNINDEPKAATSILEEESLQQWLDDVLGD